MPSQVLTRPVTAASGGGGGSVNSVTWRTNDFEFTTPFSSGQTLALSQPTSDVNSVMVNYRNGWLALGTDYTATTTVITLLFPDDPTNYDPATIRIQVKYAIVA